MRDGDFDKQLHERLELAEREKRDAIALAEAKIANALQSAAARKDTEIQALKAQLQAGDVARQLAVNEAVGVVARERDGLKNDLNLITVKNQLEEKAIKEQYALQLRDRDGEIERLRDMKAHLDQDGPGRPCALE